MNYPKVGQIWKINHTLKEDAHFVIVKVVEDDYNSPYCLAYRLHESDEILEKIYVSGLVKYCHLVSG
jgi:hypothetical protein